MQIPYMYLINYCSYGIWNRFSVDIVLQQSLNKSLSFRDGLTGGQNVYQNIRLDPWFKKTNVDKLTFVCGPTYFGSKNVFLTKNC